jgi:L-lactate dehydrogenase complex protein LldF
MNHCPVYNAIGGHAYGWVYPGPIGSVMTPALIGVGKAAHLPGASTFCGKCAEVCPMKIPLPDLMRMHRATDFAQGGGTWSYRKGLALWAWLAKRPRLYHLAMRFTTATLGGIALKRGRIRWMPFAGGWTKHRDLAAPQGRTFQQLWSETQRGVPR